MRKGDTPQYKIIQRLLPELKNAVRDNLCDLSDRLLSHDLITEEFTDDHYSVTKSI